MTKDIIKKIITKLEPSATLAINEKSKKLIAQRQKNISFWIWSVPISCARKNKIVSVLKENAAKKDYLPDARITKTQRSNFKIFK